MRPPPRIVTACLAREAEAHDYERLGGSRLRVERMVIQAVLFLAVVWLFELIFKLT
ncbi:MAG: hypothetical protein NTX64_05945 [Elusimicrobia bacterium]|nr:hypothetical protein [Elusimicrobiota bacterium]